MRLSDDQRSIIAELEADARYTAEQIEELADDCDSFNEMLCELADASEYDPPYEWPVSWDETGDDYPW